MSANDIISSLYQSIELLARRIRRLETHEGVTGSTGTLSDHSHTMSGDGGILSGDKHSSYSEYEQISTPDSPAPGSDRIYFKSDDKAYRLDTAGNEVELGGGSGGHIIQDEGSNLTARTKLNFTGSAVIASDNAVTGATDVTITGTPVAGYIFSGRSWFWYGNASVRAGRGVFVAQAAFTVQKFYAEFSTAPTGADAILVLKKNNVTIGTLTVTASTNYAEITTFSDTAIAIGDELSYAITQIGSTLPGADILVECVLRQQVIIDSAGPAEPIYIMGGRAWFYYGSLVVGAGRGIYKAQTPGTIQKFYCHLDVAPTGASLIIELKKNGATIGTLTVAATSDYDDISVFTDTAIAVDDEITYEITQVGSTVQGEGAIIEVVIEHIGTTSASHTPGGYEDFVEIAAPANPAINTARFYAKDVAGITRLAYKSSAGTELLWDSDFATHVGESDPHAQYQKESEKGAASGYASLDASTKVPIAQIPTSTIYFRGGPRWFKSGTLTVDAFPVHQQLDMAGTIEKVRCRVGTAPVGADLIVNLLDAGDNIIATVTITDGNKEAETSVISTAAVAIGDEYGFNVSQIGSTVAGSNLMVETVIKFPVVTS